MRQTDLINAGLCEAVLKMQRQPALSAFGIAKVDCSRTRRTAVNESKLGMRKGSQQFSVLADLKFVTCKVPRPCHRRVGHAEGGRQLDVDPHRAIYAGDSIQTDGCCLREPAHFHRVAAVAAGDHYEAGNGMARCAVGHPDVNLNLLRILNFNGLAVE